MFSIPEGDERPLSMHAGHRILSNNLRACPRSIHLPVSVGALDSQCPTYRLDAVTSVSVKPSQGPSRNQTQGLDARIDTEREDHGRGINFLQTR